MIGKAIADSSDQGNIESREKAAIETARLVQGTPVVGYHDERGRLIILIGYDGDCTADRGY